MKVLLLFLIVNLFASEANARFRYHTIEPREFNVIMTEQERLEQWQNGEGPLVNSQFQKKLNLITSSKVTPGNRSLLLVNGMMSYKVRYRLIDMAQKSIVMSVLSIHPGGKSGGPIEDRYTQKFVDKILKAKKRGVEIFLIYDGMTSFVSKTQRVMDQFVKVGIPVIKYNPFGSQKFDRLGFYPIDLLNTLRKAVWRRLARGEFLLNNRWHDKTMIVDGKYALVGGLNWGDYYASGNQFSAREYSFKKFIERPMSQEIGLDKIYKPSDGWGELRDDGWRDTDVLLAGPIVPVMQEQIIKDYLTLDQMKKRKKYKFQKVSPQIQQMVNDRFNRFYKDNPVYFPELPDIGNQKISIRYLFQRPFIHRGLKEHKDLKKIAKNNGLLINGEFPQTFISNYYLNLIHRAKKQILWGSFSLVAQPQIEKELLAAAKRGVKIYLITNSKSSSKTLGDKGYVTYRRNKKAYKHFLKKGRGNIRLFEWQGERVRDGHKYKSGAFHSKNMDVDGVVSIVGSYNLSRASYKHHTEGVVVLYDPEFSKQNQLMFQRDLSYTKEVVRK